MNDESLPVAPPIHLLRPETPPRGIQAPEEPTEVSVEDMRCPWCGGFHPYNCWALREVEFFPDGRWSKVVLDPRPQAESMTIYDPEEFLRGLVSDTED